MCKLIPIASVASLLALASLASCASTPVDTVNQAPASELVPFASDVSAVRLARSHHKSDFFVLANQFEGQEHGGLCGPTSAVIVLNALRIDHAADLPVDRSAIPEPYHAKIPPQYDPFFHRYTQRTFFADPRVAAIKSEAQFYGAPMGPENKPDPGFQLRQVDGVLRALGLDVTLRVLDDKVSDADARRELLDNLGRPGDYVIVNYARPVLGQEGGGHISPLGAYDEASDSFLVLDVNPNRGKTWAWVPAARLFAAMRTVDKVESRGYLLVREGAGGPERHGGTEDR